ncbi:MAG: hypothetical protein M1536_00850 [Firmicutes bacterium]|nr:hypothetical protein [Bacillota bacterium]
MFARHKKLIFIYIILLIFFASAVSLIFSKERSREKLHWVSLINLIATPEKFHGTKVRVKGFAVIRFETTAIYLSSNDFHHGITKNSVWLKIDKYKIGWDYKKYNKKYVLVEGIFDKNYDGHMGLSSGSIKQIERMETWE